MRGLLPDEKLKEIDEKLPRIDINKVNKATSQELAIDEHDAFNNKTIHVSFVCIKDACDRYDYIRMSLHEAIACLTWYNEYSTKEHRDYTARFCARYYIDYAALLLYATAEDIAAFIIKFISDEDNYKVFLESPEAKKLFKEKRPYSKAAKIGIYLKLKHSDHNLTKIIFRLHDNQNWRETIKYRNNWVHDKPPIIAGLGIEYNRNSRINRSNNGNISIGFGGGSKAEYTFDRLFDVVFNSSKAICNTLSELLDIVIAYKEIIVGQDEEKSL